MSHTFPAQVITVRKTATPDFVVGDIVAFRESPAWEKTLPAETVDEKFYLINETEATKLKGDPYY